MKLLTLSQFLRERAEREPGVTGYLDECEALEPLFFSYEDWSQMERGMAATAPGDPGMSTTLH